MIFFKKHKKTSDDDDFFIALSDIMTALMLLFL
ncbi:OmpA family protein, partial [Campylobacter coli]|nr:OmpA family protein [Campylobacter coli]